MDARQISWSCSPANALVSLSTGAGGFGLTSAKARTMSASVGSMVATVPEVFGDLSGTMGEIIQSGIPDSDLVRRCWRSVNVLRDMQEVSEEAMANIAPESWRDRRGLPSRGQWCLRAVAYGKVVSTRRRKGKLQQRPAYIGETGQSGTI